MNFAPCFITAGTPQVSTYARSRPTSRNLRRKGADARRRKASSMSIKFARTQSWSERFALGAAFRTQLPARIAERAFLELDPLPNDAFKPGVEVLFTMQPREKCRPSSKTRGQCDGFPTALHLDRRFPCSIIVRFGDDPLIDYILQRAWGR
jgi:hypothetical protein